TGAAACGPERADGAPSSAAGGRGPRAVATGPVAPGGGAMSAEVREMFASIARRYDTANEILSLGIHKGWRRTAVAVSGVAPGQRVLDCATGTGDLALEFKRTVGMQG